MYLPHQRYSSIMRDGESLNQKKSWPLSSALRPFCSAKPAVVGRYLQLVVGKNKKWKQKSEMSKISNQKFIQIPYEMLLEQLKYKCEDVGINYIEIDESYTSGTSFLDQEYPDKSNYDRTRRIVRGLFKSNSGLLINSDVNGSLQIMKKAFPNAFDKRYGIEGVLTPIVINAAKVA